MGNQSKNIASTALNSVDIFEDPIHLNMEGETGLTSSLGGFLSLLIILFLGVQAILQVIGMFKHDDPAILLMEEYEDDPSQIYLNNTNNFILAVTATQDNMPVNMSKDSMLSFTSSYNRYVRSQDGSTTKYKYKIHWAPCQESDFPSEIFDEGSFEVYGLEYAYCPTSIDMTHNGNCPEEVLKKYPDCLAPPQFTVKGTFLSIEFEFIQFKLKKCDQLDSSLVNGLKCHTGDIEGIFENSEVQLNLYYANNLINPVDYTVPNKSYIDTMYWNLNPSVAKVADIFVDTETVQDYDSYFFTDTYKNNSFYSLKSEKMRELEDFQGENLLEWNLRRSNLNRVTSRTYAKILDVVSNIGGMSELIILIGAVIAIGYARYKYQSKLSNELYDFQPLNKKDNKRQGENTSSVAGLKSANEMDNLDASTKRRTFRESRILTSFFGRKKTYEDNTSKTVKDYFELQHNKKRELKYGELRYFKQLLCCCLVKNDPEEQLAKKAREQATKDLDIIKVIEKLKEIDKLKRLLLNRHQRETFNFIEKPMIMLEGEEPYHKESFRENDGDNENPQIFDAREEYDSLSSYAKLYVSYRFLRDDPERANYRYNKKLLDMIGEDLIKVFKQVDHVMGNNVDPSKFEEIVKKIMDEPNKVPAESSPELNLEL